MHTLQNQMITLDIPDSWEDVPGTYKQINYIQATDSWKDPSIPENFPKESSSLISFIKYRHYQAIGWKDDKIIEDSNFLIRFEFYERSEWKDIRAKRDEKWEIRLFYYFMNNWKDYDWYRDEWLELVIFGFATAVEFKMNSEFYSAINRVLHNCEPHYTIPIDKWYLIASHLSSGVIKQMLLQDYPYKQYTDLLREELSKRDHKNGGPL